MTKAFKIKWCTVTELRQSTMYQTKKVMMSWKQTDGAVGYAVYKSATKDGGYKYIKTVKKNSCVCGNLKSGSSAYYKVRAYKIVNGEKIYSEYSTAKKMYTRSIAPTNFKVSLDGRTVKMKWSKVNGVNGYTVYVSDSRNGKYEVYGSVSSDVACFEKAGLKAGRKYYFKVCAYIKNSTGKKIYSGNSEIRVINIGTKEIKQLIIDKTIQFNQFIEMHGGLYEKEYYEPGYQGVLQYNDSLIQSLIDDKPFPFADIYGEDFPLEKQKSVMIFCMIEDLPFGPSVEWLYDKEGVDCTYILRNYMRAGHPILNSIDTISVREPSKNENNFGEFYTASLVARVKSNGKYYDIYISDRYDEYRGWVYEILEIITK